MKKLIIAILLVASSVFAAGEPSTFGNGTIIQGCSFDGTESALLTVNSVTKDNSLYSCFAVYAPADCKIRLMATSSKTGSVSETVVGGIWSTFVVNKQTPFANLSACTSGNFRRNTARAQQ